MISRRHGLWLLSFLVVALCMAAATMPPIPQDLSYHHFADQRTLLGMPNFWNVLSNVGYLLAGVYGLLRLKRLQVPESRPAYLIFCVATTLVAFGSGWYHYSPDNDSLVWDRLPMAPGFMALLALVLGERVSWRLSRVLLWPLVVLGVASVLYWAWTESHDAGDLRPYALVQFVPVLLLPLLILLFPGSASTARWLWCAFAGYGAAKIAEHFDLAIYGAVGLSGHSIKHLVSSAAVLFAVLAATSVRDPTKARTGR